jgi:hypothetical protein
MKQCAFGALINKNRNILANDEDYTKECDYQLCEYEAYDPEPQEKDYSTYDILYTKINLDSIIKIIREIYYKENSYTLNQIEYYISKKLNPRDKKSVVRKSFVISSLEYIMNNKIEIINKFGYKCFLLEDSGNFYLDINYPQNDNNYLMNFYSRNILINKRKNLNQLTNYFNKEKIEEQISTFESDMKSIDSFETLDFNSKLRILESTLKDFVENSNKKDKLDLVLKYFRFFIFVLPKYVKAAPKKGRGRPRKMLPIEEAKEKLKKVNLSDISPDDIPTYQSYKDFNDLDNIDENVVLVHTFMSKKPKDKNYGSTTALLKGADIRILDNDWHDPIDQDELIYYNNLIQATIIVDTIMPIRQKAKNIKLYGVHSTELDDKTGNFVDQFKVANFQKEEKLAVEGQRCINFKIPQIVEFLWRSGYDDFVDDKYPPIPEPKQSVAEMRKILSMDDDDSEDEKVIFYFKMMKSDKKRYGLTVEGLCDRLDNFLTQKDLVLDL